MRPWIEAAAAALLALGGVLLGRWFSRRPKPYWAIGYLIPLALILCYGLASRKPALSFFPPFSWLVLGRNKFVSVGLIATMVLTTPLSRIRPRRTRWLISFLMALIVFYASVWPLLAPAFNRRHLASLQTHIDVDGVCLQSTDYNCGPAAAVTALRRLGFPAEEGTIAILAHTSSAAGTPPDVLAEALQEHYGTDGLVSQYRVFRNLEELSQAGLTLAVIRYTFWIDHYVVVLRINDGEVRIADPSTGQAELSVEDFLAKWRYVGVTLKRNGR